MSKEESFYRSDSLFASSKRSYSDLVLAAAIVMIIALMILPLPLWVVDTLVALNILIGVGLVLLAIYIPSVTAFSSFPSVIMLSTLFRLALSIAITRLILLEADAGEIIETFGRIVVGGNVVVGIVVFIIITVVQFIVIAKGSERVAEVAARFSLDAMPGKQLSIDSDLRSGLLDKSEAKHKRKMLELESQLHGSLDGAMKFVKGDSIAGIVILIVNILGGLTIGVMQRGMDIGTALETYSVLTVGDGLVAQIPALLTSIAAGLIITRTASEDTEGNLGAAISSQIASYPKVVIIGGILSLLLMFVPGFPWPIFLIMALLLLGYSAWRHNFQSIRQRLPFGKPETVDAPAFTGTTSEPMPPLAPVTFAIASDLKNRLSFEVIFGLVNAVISQVREEYGVPIPRSHVQIDEKLAPMGYRFEAHGVRLWCGTVDSSFVNEEIEKTFTAGIRAALLRRLGFFLGIQETADLINNSNQDYPDLIKEMLRFVAPQRLAEIMRRLLQECIPIRNLRDLYEAIIDAGSREKDITLIVEMVRVSLKHQISDRFTDENRNLRVLLVHPDVEDALHQSMRNSNNGQFSIDPGLYKQLMEVMSSHRDRLAEHWSTIVVLCSSDIRRHVRRLLEEEYFSMPVLSYLELAGDVRVESMGHINL